MSAELQNPFESSSSHHTMQVWHRGHQDCKKEYGFHNCKKEKITFKIPDIIETKIDDFCQRHQRNFDNELHRFPSGAIKWLGCPVCQRNDKKFRDKQDFIMFMKDIGMRLNEDTNVWFKPQLPGEETEKTTNKKLYSYKD